MNFKLYNHIESKTEFKSSISRKQLSEQKENILYLNINSNRSNWFKFNMKEIVLLYC